MGKGKSEATLLKQEINAIKKDTPKIATLSDEYIFSIVCYKYFFNDGELSLKDYKEIFVDGKDDGGIDLVDVKEDFEGQATLLLIQGKFWETINLKDVVNVFTWMARTYQDFRESRTAKYNDRLKRIFKEKLDDIEEKGAIYKLVLFTSAVVSDEMRRNILTEVAKVDELSAFEVEINDRNEIEEQIRNILDPKEFVPQGRIEYAKECGKLTYKDNGLLVNVSANSIKDLFDTKKDSGLFSQNFRYYIRNKKIDDNINKSLSKLRDDFWFLNNGIIIGCKDFHDNGDHITLYDFSIINGCQTTTLIGKYRGKNQGDDFFLPCKIVKPMQSKEDRFHEFIGTIAEASNSQKPISPRDLKANRAEQKRLQEQLKQDDPKIYLEIKRGEDFKIKKKCLFRWQYLNNDKFGQLVLSFHLQQPGTARSGKAKIFNDESVYGRIFRTQRGKPGVVDLLKLNAYYDEYVEAAIRDGKFTDPVMESVANNGKLAIIALIGFLIKVRRRLVDTRGIQKVSSGDGADWDSEIRKDNIEGGIFNPTPLNDFDIRLNSLFETLIYELADLYSRGAETSVSNFFKTDLKYSTKMLAHIIAKCLNNQMKKRELDKMMDVFL